MPGKHHGLSRTKEWWIWKSMKQRCLNPKNKCFKDYGHRGITVCEQWMDFENFIRDMGKCPEGMTLERKDNTLGYSPENCKWATDIEQQNNRRNNVYVTLGGITLTVAQWASKHGVRPRTAARRLRDGWPAALAVSTPPDKNIKVRNRGVRR